MQPRGGGFGRLRIGIDPVASTVETGFASGMSLPLVASPRMAGIDLAEWFSHARGWVDENLHRHGAILFRGFSISSVDALAAASRALIGELLPYLEGRSPRSELGERVYTSTIHPSDQRILAHNETSYAQSWPMRLLLCCIRPAESGGATPLYDSRRVLSRLSVETRESFLGRGVRYQRHFGLGMGVTWWTAFGTHDRRVVEDRCREAGVAYEWRERDELVTWQDRHAVAVHPHTHEQVWFNQAHHFHPRTLTADAKQIHERDGVAPWNAYYGDGASISDDTIDEIVECYEREEITFPWEKGDLLVIDNMLVAHGRTTYRGERRIALTLGRMHSPFGRRDGLVTET